MSSDLAVLWRECERTQYELAERARLNQGTLSRVFAGKRRLSPKAEARLRAVLEAVAADRRERELREALGGVVLQSDFLFTKAG